MALTDTVIRTVKPKAKSFKLADAGQLYLVVNPSGLKVWRQDYAFDGKRKTATIGPYPTVTLAEARMKRDEIKRSLFEGRDPYAKEADGPTLRTVAEDWFRANSPRWKTSYSGRIWSRIEADILSQIGDQPIASIEAPAVLDLLRKIEDRDAIYTARRIGQMMSTIFKFAIASGLTKFNPAASLHVALKPVPRESHRAALAVKDLPAFLHRLNGYQGDAQTRLALKFVAHTFPRTNEIRFATWSEFDGDTWRIDGSRMKMGKTHLVPLSTQARNILDCLKAIAGDSEWVLPGADRRKPISENTLIYAMYRLGYHGRATVHGFRATASTILNESNEWRFDAIERQLSHVPQDEVRSAYNAALYWDERVRMMQWYSDLLDRQEAAGRAKFDLEDVL